MCRVWRRVLRLPMRAARERERADALLTGTEDDAGTSALDNAAQVLQLVLLEPPEAIAADDPVCKIRAIGVKVDIILGACGRDACVRGKDMRSEWWEASLGDRVSTSSNKLSSPARPRRAGLWGNGNICLHARGPMPSASPAPRARTRVRERAGTCAREGAYQCRGRSRAVHQAGPCRAKRASTHHSRAPTLFC